MYNTALNINITRQPVDNDGYANEDVNIITHNGVFHADEVMAVAVLSMTRSSRVILRTRDQEVLDLFGCNSVAKVDIGGKYNPSYNQWDHHHDARLSSSAGLVWDARGVRRVSTLHPELSESQVDAIVSSIKEEIINGIDAIDTGRMEATKGEIPSMSLSAVISSFNAEDVYSPQQDEAFLEAVRFAHDLMVRVIKTKAKAAMAEAEVVAAGIEASKAMDGIMVLDRPIPWVSAVMANWDSFKDVQVVMYFSGKEGDWRVQTLPGEIGSPQSMRCPAPSAGRGLRGEYLDAVTGVEGCTFIHAGGFIGGATSAIAAMELAKWWISNSRM